VLLHLAVSHAVDLDASEGHFLAGRQDTLELAAVGASEDHTNRHHVPLGEDVSARQARIGGTPRSSSRLCSASRLSLSKSILLFLPTQIFVDPDPQTNGGPG
jgi:hypothetical protein